MENTVAIKPVTLYRGVTEAARKCGVSQGHLSRVLSGERVPGKELERKLRKMGIRLQKAERRGQRRPVCGPFSVPHG